MQCWADDATPAAHTPCGLMHKHVRCMLISSGCGCMYSSMPGTHPRSRCCDPPQLRPSNATQSRSKLKHAAQCKSLARAGQQGRHMALQTPQALYNRLHTQTQRRHTSGWAVLHSPWPQQHRPMGTQGMPMTTSLAAGTTPTVERQKSNWKPQLSSCCCCVELYCRWSCWPRVLAHIGTCKSSRPASQQCADKTCP